MGSPTGLATAVDPLNFQVPRHVRFLDRKIFEVCTSQQRGLLVMMPPQHGKSTMLSKWTPPWYIGRYPNRRVLLITYGGEYSEDYGGFCRDILEDHGQEFYGITVATDSKAKGKWRIEGSFNGGMDSQGHQGQISGKPGDLILMDDLVKNPTEAQSEAHRKKVWDTYQTVMNTRRTPVASQAVLMTHWHRLDIAGRLLDMIAGSPRVAARWEVIRLPALAHENDPLGRQPGEALWPERFNEEYLLDIQESTSPYWWSALYDQHPIAGDAMEWPADYFTHDELWFDDFPENDVLRVMALDPSKGRTKHADFSAFVFISIARNGIAYVDAHLERMPSEAIKEKCGELMARWDPDTFVLEANSWQDELAYPIMLRCKAHGVNRPEERLVLVEHYGGAGGSKIERIRSSTIGERLQKRAIKFRNNNSCKILVEQLREFPLAEYDDGPDSLEMCLDQVGAALADGGGRGDRIVGRIA
jgi:hypothetical protein